MASLIHLVRHGEVDNPENLVYASMPGFGLSDRGRVQAKMLARHLRPAPVVAVWSSPLQRALETAAPIASTVGVAVRVHEHLAEWKMLDTWAGTSWPDLPEAHPGQLEQYLDHPADLDFAAESLGELAARMTEKVREINAMHPGGDVVVVSHQDPVQAVRLAVTGGRLETLHTNKPRHAEVISLDPSSGWKEVHNWAPEQD